MQSDFLITKDKALDLIKKFATEYRKELGKAPGEIIFVGGGSILLNYDFRDGTQDFDVILKTVSGIHDVILKFADDYGLPKGWMNTDFIETTSYSKALPEVSKHYTTLNNDTLEIRTVSGEYLIAMKLRANRDYRNDISDVIGIIREEKISNNPLTVEKIIEAYDKLYSDNIPDELLEEIENFCNCDIDVLKIKYNEYRYIENEINSKLVNYVRDGVKLNADNVSIMIDKIKKKINDRNSNLSSRGKNESN